jgi:hypothetical protein
MDDQNKMKPCFECESEKDDGSGKMLPFWISCILGIIVAGAVIVIFKMIVG